MTTRRLLILAFTALAFAPAAVRAQQNGNGAPQNNGQRERDKESDIPKPPPGMCRIVVGGVPADKQPAPTDCATALKNKPTNGQVIFGESRNGNARIESPATRGATTPFSMRSVMPPITDRFPTTTTRMSAPPPVRDSVARPAVRKDTVKKKQ